LVGREKVEDRGGGGNKTYGSGKKKNSTEIFGGGESAKRWGGKKRGAEHKKDLVGVVGRWRRGAMEGDGQLKVGEKKKRKMEAGVRGSGTLAETNHSKKRSETSGGKKRPKKKGLSIGKSLGGPSC